MWILVTSPRLHLADHQVWLVTWKQLVSSFNWKQWWAAGDGWKSKWPGGWRNMEATMVFIYLVAGIWWACEYWIGQVINWLGRCRDSLQGWDGAWRVAEMLVARIQIVKGNCLSDDSFQPFSCRWGCLWKRIFLLKCLESLEFKFYHFYLIPHNFLQWRKYLWDNMRRRRMPWRPDSQVQRSFPFPFSFPLHVLRPGFKSTAAFCKVSKLSRAHTQFTTINNVALFGFPDNAQ